MGMIDKFVNGTYILFEKDKEMKKIIESTKVLLYWNLKMKRILKV